METKSKLHLYSLGIVGENKAMKSEDGGFNDLIEVVPIEVSLMVDGEINGDRTKLSADGQDALGAAYSVEIDTSNTIEAQWLPMNRGNRLSPPDLRRGDKVKIWRYADSDKYYWTEYDDLDKRRLETVVFRYSGTSDEDAVLGPDNCYYIEISTHKGLIHVHTSTANKEKSGYDIQVNGAEGFLQIQDTHDNTIMMKAEGNQIELQNGDGSFYNMIGKEIHIYAPELIAMKTKHMTIDAELIDTNATTINTKATTNTLKADTNNTEASTNNLTASQNNITATTSHTGQYGITGKLTVSGLATFSGGLSIGGSIKSLGGGFNFASGGQLTVDSITSTGNVNAPNIK